MTSKLITKCQVCGHPKLTNFFFAGFLPPVNTLYYPHHLPATIETYPAGLFHCPTCQLVQMNVEVDSKTIFPTDYAYRSGTTRSLCTNFLELIDDLVAKEWVKPGSVIVDIGANDGTLLKGFKEKGCTVWGIEPTDAAVQAGNAGIPTFQAFFNAETARNVLGVNGGKKVDVITACNVFAHMPDIHGVMNNLLQILDEKGIFVSESHYLPTLLSNLQYDTIYHEHLRYYSLSSLHYLFEKYGLGIIYAKKIPTHGGSIRVYAQRKAYVTSVAENVATLLDEEKGHCSSENLQTFAQKVVRTKLDLMALLNQCQPEGVCAIGAPSRATTLINYVGLDEGIIRYIGEVPSSPKIGKCVPGTLIPIVDEKEVFTNQCGYALLLSWHLRNEIIPKLREKGFKGRFIVPLPTPEIVDS